MGRRLRFGEWCFEPDTHVVSTGGVSTTLEPRVARLLGFMLRHPGELLSRERLIEAVWDGRVVSDEALRRAVWSLRQVFSGRDGEAYIRTVHKSGYIASFPTVVEEPAAGTEAPVAVAEPPAMMPLPSAAAPAVRVKRWWVVLAAAAGLAALLVLAWALNWMRPAEREPPSLAVLPFSNRTAPAEDAGFADGLHDELLTQLAQIADLKVISRTSVMRFRDSELPLPEIARQLGVAAILEGSVQRAGAGVRVNVQLIDAASDQHLWAESFERALTTDNLFAIQREITRRVTRSLHATLTREEAARIGRVPTANLEAYQYYMEGRRQVDLRTIDSLRQGRILLERAIALDPEFAPALAELASALVLLNQYAQLPRAESLSPAGDLIDRALAIDPDFAGAHASLGYLRWIEFDDAGAETALQRAIELAPGEPSAWHWLANARMWQGRYEEHFELASRAFELDPLSQIMHSDLATALHGLGRDEEALAELKRVQELHPTAAVPWEEEANIHATHGDPVAGLRAGREFERRNPASSDNVWQCSRIAELDDLDLADACAAAYLARHNDDPHIPLFRQRVRLAMGDAASARAIAQQVATMPEVTGSPRWELGLVMAYVNIGEMDSAQRLVVTHRPGWLSPSPEVLPHERYYAAAAAVALQASGETAQAERLLRTILAGLGSAQRARGAAAYGHIDVAVHALLGERERALAALEEVAAIGYFRNWPELKAAPQFASIRDDPRFAQALATLTTKAAAQRRIAEQEGLLSLPAEIAAATPRADRAP